MYNIYYNTCGGENIKKIIAGICLLLAIGLIIGGYAFVSNDFPSQAINNPVPNEVDNVSSVSDDFNPITLKDIIATKDFIQKYVNVTSDSVDAFVNNLNNSSQSTGYSIGYAAYVGDSSKYKNSPQTTQLTDIFVNDINESDYILSPNYNRSIFIKKGQDFTDKYGLCVVDGFIPLGNITKPLETNFICHLDCGINDVYFDLSSPYVYDVTDIIYCMEHGSFPDEIQKKAYEYEINRLNMNYRQVPGQEEIFVNVHDDFTDKYVFCIDCGRYVALGNVTSPLDEVMICDHPTHFGAKNYFNVNDSCVISREEAYDSWNSDTRLQELYSNPDYHPVHFDEENYGAELPKESSQQYFWR